ncbi:MAG: hypothetical protein L0J60_06420 [Psychroflexus sp.]|nr:hypothetical protein [Psychroflexus sp.]
MKKLFAICFLILSVHLAKAQEFEGRLFEEFESPRLSILEDPFSVKQQIENSISSMKIDLDVDPFASKPQINMVAAIERKKQSQSRSLDDFSFVQRQLASFRANKPKIDNSSVDLYSPSYNEQPIYSGSNRVKNSVYKDLGDQYKFRTGFRSPYYNRSSRNRSRNRFYFGAY